MYTDKEKLEITNLEYKDYIRGAEVVYSHDKKVDHVSEVNHKAWGEFTIRKIGGD